jgi:hypothetical protein
VYGVPPSSQTTEPACSEKYSTLESERSTVADHGPALAVTEPSVGRSPSCQNQVSTLTTEPLPCSSCGFQTNSGSGTVIASIAAWSRISGGIGGIGGDPPAGT